jgi:hypothetical protein
MKFIKFIIVYSLILIELVGCTKVPVVKSFPVLEMDDSSKISGIDPKTKIVWKLSNNKSNLYFKFETSERSIQQIIMREGFTLFFDTTGRKKENLSFEIKNSYNKFKMPLPQPMKDRNDNKPEKKKIINESFSELCITDNESAEVINLILEKTSFSATYKIDSFNTMICKVVIPILSIHPHGLTSINKLSMGLKIQPKMNGGPGKRPEGGMGPVGSRGGEEGMGISGSLSRGEMPGVRMQAGSGSMGDRGDSRNQTSVIIWFATELVK